MSHSLSQPYAVIASHLSWLSRQPQHVIIAIGIAIAAVATTLTSPPVARLLSVPVFIALAITDIRTRRIRNWVWPPLYAFGITILCLELATLWPLTGSYAVWIGMQLGIGFGLIVPLFYLLWKYRGFGGADFKVVVAAVCIFPLFTPITVAGIQFPLYSQLIISPPLAIVFNGCIGGVYPLWLALRNLANNRISTTMFVTRMMPVEDIDSAHGLIPTTDKLSTRGADIDTIRMYLRWRGLTLSELRAHPNLARDPTTIIETGSPLDGRSQSPLDESEYGTTDFSVATDNVTPPSEATTDTTDTNPTSSTDRCDTEDAIDPQKSSEPPAVDIDSDDGWGVEAFYADMSHPLYRTSREELRTALEMIADPHTDTIQVQVGLPFLVFVAIGICITLIVGNPMNTFMAFVAG